MSNAHSGKAKILIVYYSTYGHVQQMAEHEAKGATEAGAEVKITQFPETLSEEILKKMYAPPKANHPAVTHDDLLWADGIIIGFPTRYGSPAAQFKSFWDSTGQLWQKGALVGKPVSTFFSTATQNGGQETTALTSYTNFVHHGMVIVPMGYTDTSLFDLSEIHGGSPYGAGTLAGGDGSRKPSKTELSLAEHQGKYFTGVATALKLGREIIANKK